jgi:hypothetical protein
MAFETVETGVAELWQPSVQIRWFEFNKRIVQDGNFGAAKVMSEKKLQQLHNSNLGNREWRDVPTETES